MKKIWICILCLISLLALGACSSQSGGETAGSQPASEAATQVQSQSSQDNDEGTAEGQSVETQSLETEADESQEHVISEGAAVRVGSLKGPTSMGLVSLMDQNQKGESSQSYDFKMVTAADELVAAVSSGDVDIALVPANVASVLYNKTEGKISVLDINTLGVLYVVESKDTIQSVSDLKGKTLYLTGKGTTPDYALQYVLSQNGLTTDDVTLEYKSEAAEVAAVLANDENAIGLLPQPFVTVACNQNEKLHIALDLTEEWDKAQGEDGSQLVTGVTIVRNDFLENNEEVVKTFLEESKTSVEFTNSHQDEAAELIVQQGIVEKAAIAKQAIPYCNITYIDGEAMKTALGGYLSVLHKQDAQSVGGQLPGDDFYYISSEK
ncbi:MAG: ABC transporter substrate-binding protein [Clostridiales bacterium]|nr:ABC transporter substrate-binding protein [Clostridiales bacterium]